MSNEKHVKLSDVGNVKKARSREEKVCLKTYSLETVKKTCYRFSSSHFYQLESDGHQAKIIFHFPSTITSTEEQEIVERFHQDILDQDLREIVSRETEVARNLILANAFSQTDLVESEDEK